MSDSEISCEGGGGHLLSGLHSSGVSTLGARKPLYQNKMVLCSHLEYPICDCVNSYCITPCLTPFGITSLATSTKQWTVTELRKRSPL